MVKIFGMYEDKIMDYKEAYFCLCSDLYNGYTNKDVKKHNKAMNKLNDLLESIRTEEDKSFYLELLEADDVRVRLSSASDCLLLNVFVEEAKNTLSLLVEDKANVSVSLSAKLTLLVWEKQGHL